MMSEDNTEAAMKFAHAAVQNALANFLDEAEASAPEGVEIGIFKEGNDDFFYINSSLITALMGNMANNMEALMGPDEPIVLGARVIEASINDLFLAAIIKVAPEVYAEVLDSMSEG